MMEKTAVITGPTSGIGLEIAKGLVKAGYHLILVARNPQKVEAVRQALSRNTTNGSSIETEITDLTSLAEVESLAQRLTTRLPSLALLVNNAGVFAAKKSLTKDGIELDLAVNHLAPFVLTWRLLPLLRQQPGARVVYVNSDSHERTHLEPTDLEADAHFRLMAAYSKSKLASMFTIVELASRVPAQNVTINAVHPGLVGTDISKEGGRMVQFGWSLAKPFMLSPEKGADTPLWAATAPELAGASGNYYKKRAIATMNPQLQDSKMRQFVWQRTFELAGLDPEN